jgi:hypothetical protein
MADIQTVLIPSLRDQGPNPLPDIKRGPRYKTYLDRAIGSNDEIEQSDDMIHLLREEYAIKVQRA